MRAEGEVISILREEVTCSNRELRYRLERKFSHDVTNKAIQILEAKGRIRSLRLNGFKFYYMGSREEAVPLAREKASLMRRIISASREAGRHAEEAWINALSRLGMEILSRGVSAGGRHDLDALITMKGEEVLIEVKNGLNYPDDLFWKVLTAWRLRRPLVIIARWLSPAQLRLLKGIPKIIYADAIYPSRHSEMVHRAREMMGYPMEVRDLVDREYAARILDFNVSMDGLRDVVRRAKDPGVRRALGDRVWRP